MKEYIIEVVMKAGGYRRFREWGYSAGEAYMKLKKYEQGIGTMKKATEA